MATIKEDYVSFETAKLLKKKGFDKDFDADIVKWYNADKGDENLCSLVDFRVYKCPSLAMMMKWLREAHNRYIEICTDRAHNFKDIIFRPAIYDRELDCLWESDNFLTYEQACEAAIKYCLENLI